MQSVYNRPYSTSVAFYEDYNSNERVNLCRMRRRKSSRKLASLLRKTRDLVAIRGTLLLNFKSRWRKARLSCGLAQKEPTVSVAAVTQTNVECSQPR